MSVSADASAEDIQRASNEAAFQQISDQFADQSATNDTAGWGKLEAPTLGDDGISFKSAYKGSHATISFNGSGGSGQAADGTDASIAAGSIEINGVRVSYAAKTFEATAPGQDETSFHRQASEHIRNAINAASGQTNVVAGVALDNSLSLVSSLTGSRSMIKLGEVFTNVRTGARMK